MDTLIMPKLYPEPPIFSYCNGHTVFDVGANEGGYCETFFNNGAAKIYAFEPGRKLCEMMRTKFANRPIVVEECAVSDEIGVLKNVTWIDAWTIGNPDDQNFSKMSISPGACNLAEQHERFDVCTITLDNYMEKNQIEGDVKLLKIDVDGYEYKVLKGASALLDRYRPIMYLELSLYVNVIMDSSSQKLINLIKQHNYQFVTADGRPFSYEVADREWPRNSSCDVYLLPKECLHEYQHYLREEIL